MKTLILAGAVAIMTATSANALCRAPGQAPKPPQSFDRPYPPACLQVPPGRENECDPRELDRYAEEVADYIKKLDDFVFAAERYAEEASRYASCEADEARETLSN